MKNHSLNKKIHVELFDSDNSDITKETKYHYVTNNIIYSTKYKLN